MKYTTHIKSLLPHKYAVYNAYLTHSDYFEGFILRWRYHKVVPKNHNDYDRSIIFGDENGGNVFRDIFKIKHRLWVREMKFRTEQPILRYGSNYHNLKGLDVDIMSMCAINVE